MKPARAIAMLDRQLAAHGQTVTLRRPGTPAVSADLPAFVRGYKPQELVGAITQGDSEVTLSPTHIAESGWPGALAQVDGTDAAVPRKGDKVVIQGRLRNVEAAVPIYLAGTLVRVNLTVRG
jgi:hypothetical protein